MEAAKLAARKILFFLGIWTCWKQNRWVAITTELHGAIWHFAASLSFWTHKTPTFNATNCWIKPIYTIQTCSAPKYPLKPKGEYNQLPLFPISGCNFFLLTGKSWLVFERKAEKKPHIVVSFQSCCFPAAVGWLKYIDEHKFLIVRHFISARAGLAQSQFYSSFYWYYWVL